MIVVDGNDGTGKSTLAAALRALGYEVQDRGLPTKATDEGIPEVLPENELYLILDVPEAVSLERLQQAGKDMTEHWHHPDVLTHYRNRFREVAAGLKVPLIDSTGTAETVLEQVLSFLKSPWKPLQVGIPKGRLFDEVARRMEKAGYPLEVTPRNYHPRCEGIHPFILKPRSIPQMVALGLLDVGFCGRDLVRESGYDDRLVIAHDLDTQRVRLLAAAADPKILETPPKRPLVIATEFPLMADRWATGRNLAHICINTWGSTEAWAPTYADLVLDVVETGETMAANGLTILEEIMESTTVMIVSAEYPRHALHHKFVSALKTA
ncbi:MAG: ATP phosphoribosyltransferase [Blastocatellia bacterium]|nr:ATP phosphoribosyltransferase [Blastocatellia bacterium]